MKIHPLCIGILVCFWIASGGKQGWAQEAKPSDSKTPVADDSGSEDLKAVRAAVETYVESFNAANAPDLAKCWSDKGVYVASDGARLVGPTSIERHFAEYFEENPGLRLIVTIDSLRLLDANVAIEEGTAYLQHDDESDNQSPSESTYVAVHVKREGAWKLDTVRETEVPESQQEDGPLNPLNWLIGEWTDDSLEGVQAESSYRWANNNKFIVNTFQVVVDGTIDLEGTQIIGWDPSRQAIRSWMFDSDGGFGEGTWSQGDSDDEWTIEMKSMMPDGRHASAVNHYSPTGDGAFKWSSTNRRVGEAELPDVDPIEVKRTMAGD